MKPGLLFSALLVITIAIAASFGLSVLSTNPIYNIPESMIGSVLYVCPAASESFTSISKILIAARQPITIVFFFFLTLTVMAYGWALYQNLLADKYEKKKYEFAWFLAKSLFWITIVITILMHTPNYYRTVKLNGATGDYVLCESNTQGARPVHANAVMNP